MNFNLTAMEEALERKVLQFDEEYKKLKTERDALKLQYEEAHNKAEAFRLAILEINKLIPYVAEIREFLEANTIKG